MPQKCKVCRHKDRVDIDAAVVANVPLRDIALRFGGFTHGSLQRHIGNCMGDALNRAVEAELIEWGASTDERIKAVLAEAQTNLQMARANDDAAGANGAVGLILKTLALSAKLRGELKEGPAVSIDARSITVASDDEVLRKALAELQGKVLV